MTRILGLAVGVGLGAVASAPAMAQSSRLPGKMVFAALVTPDLVAAEQFYTDLFRWQFSNAYAGSSLIGQATFDGRVVAAIVQKPSSGGQRPAWRSFLSTSDVDDSVRLAVEHGATVLVAPHEIAGVGRDALLADPQGAVFGLLTSSGSDPADITAAPGGWIWSTLVTTDPGADASFYKAVLGYEMFDPQDAQDPNHVTLVSQSYARASVNPMPADHPVSHPRWISYVRVTDMSATVARATALGGHVVVAPHQDRNGSSIALMADPAGALFGLLLWSDEDGSQDQSAGAAK